MKFIYLLAISASLMLAACDSQQSREAKYMARGKALFEKGDYDHARLEYRNAAKVAPVDPEVSYRLGLVDEAQLNIGGAYGDFMRAEQQDGHYQPALLKLAAYDLAGGQIEQAQARVTTVLADAPDQPQARALHAALLLRQQDFAGSEGEARFALAKEPANITAISVLTGLYLAQKDKAKAIATIDDGVAKNPGDISLLLLQAQIYRQAQDFSRVDQSYQAIFKLRPDDAQFRVDLANLYIANGKYDEAEATLRAAIAAKPEDFGLKHQLVQLLGDHRSLEAAEQEVQGYMKAYPANDDLYFWLADLYTAHNAVDKAVALLEQVAARNTSPKDGLNARASLARIDFVRGNKDLAQQLVNTVLASDRTNREALFIRAGLAYDHGNYENAVSDLRTIVQDRPDDIEAHKLLAETLLKQGYLNLAVETMEKVAVLAPSDLEAQVRLAQMYNARKDSAHALEILAGVTKADPMMAVAWESTARVAIEAGDFPTATSAIKTLSALDGQQMTATFLEGELIAKQGDSQKAIGLYTQVIDADPNSPLAEHSLTALVNTSQAAGKIGDASAYIGSLKGKSPYALTLLGESYMKENRAENAKAALDEAIAAKPADQQPYIDRARLYLVDHQNDQALDILARGIEAAPGDIRAPMMQADILDTLGEYQKAIALYDDILARSPGLDVAANNQAAMIANYAYTDPAALDKALKRAQKFSTASHPELLDTLAWVYYRKGNTQLALTTMSRAISLAKTVPPEMHYHYGSILMKAARSDEAKAELAQALGPDAHYAGIDEARVMLSGSPASPPATP